MIYFFGKLKTNKKSDKVIAWLIALNNSEKPLRDFIIENPIPDSRIKVSLDNNPRGNKYNAKYEPLMH